MLKSISLRKKLLKVGIEYDKLLPENNYNLTDLRKARVFVFILLFLGLIFLSFLIVNQKYNYATPTPQYFFGLFPLLIYFLFKKSNNLILCSNLLALLLALVFIESIFLTGGIYSDNLLWFIAVPLISLLFSKPIYGLIWLSIDIALIVIFYFLDVQNAGYYRKQTEELDAAYHLISYIGLAIMTFGIAFIFATGQSLLVKEIDDLNKESVSSKKYIKEKLKLIDAFVLPFQQYLTFFPEFIKTSKKVKIEFKIERLDDGLELQVLPTSEIPIEKINEWLNEYISFIKTKIDDIVVKTEGNPTKQEVDFLILKLQNQISHLQNSLNIMSVEKNMLLEQNEFLKQLTIAFVSGVGQKNISKLNQTTILPDITKLRELIIKNELQEVLQIIIDGEPKKSNEAIMLLSEFQRIKKEKSMNLISEEVYAKSFNQIRHATLFIVDELQ